MAMSGIHTHSGPGGYLQYILYIITSLGFVRESFDVLVGGIVEVSSCSDHLHSCHTAFRGELCACMRFHMHVMLPILFGTCLLSHHTCLTLVLLHMCMQLYLSVFGAGNKACA